MKKRIAAVFAAFTLAFALCAVPAAAAELSSSDAVIGGADEPTSIMLVSEDGAETELDINYDDDFEYGLVSDSEAEKTADDTGMAMLTGEQRDANIKDSLKIMGQGMLGIFVVMLLIYLVIVILNKATAGKDGGNDD